MIGFGSPESLAWLADHGALADSVELKALLVGPVGPVAEALTGRASPTWSERRAYLLDTADLHLVRAGVDVRLRRRARGRHDLSVSVHRNGTGVGQAVPRGARVEFDVVPGTLWQDVEVRRAVDPAAAADVIAGVTAPAELLSAPQRSWAHCGGHAVVDDARLRELRLHGPLVVHRVKVTARQVGLHRADLEVFRYPSGRELVELSTRCGPREVGATADAFERLLDERSVSVAPRYRTKSSVWQDEIGTGPT